MKLKLISYFIFLIASSVSLAQEGKWVFINGKYIPYRASGRYEINGETIFYKNERTYDRVPENKSKDGLDPYGRPISKAAAPPKSGPAVTTKTIEANINRLKAQSPPPAASPVAPPVTPATTVNAAPPPPTEPQGEKPLAEPYKSY